MTEGRKKKPTTKPLDSSNNVASVTNVPDVLPIGDPFERMLTTPKESLIQRAASPRRSTASPLKSSKGGTAEIFLEQLPKLSGTKKTRQSLISLCN